MKRKPVPRKVTQVCAHIDEQGRYLVLAVCEDGTLWKLGGLWEAAPKWEPFVAPPAIER